MKRKLLSIFMVIAMGLCAIGTISVSAYGSTQYGQFLYYTESNDEITITDCDTSATEIVIPEKINGKPVTSIGDEAFYGCTGLTSITIPDGVTSIGNYAFDGCTDLTSITIPDSVTYIGDSAFYNCESLTSIIIPNGVTSIGESAFYNCSSLTDVYYTGSETEWAQISIGSDNKPLTNATIHYNFVPSVAPVVLETLTETGKPITTVNGQKLFVTTPQDMTEGACVILVCYKNKVLVETQKAVNTGETLYFVVDSDFDEVKVMAWESLTSMKPIGKAEIVDLS